MTDRYIEALLQATNVFYGGRKAGPGDRQLRVFLHVAQSGPETVEQIAEATLTPKGTAYDDLRALGKGAESKRGHHLIDEIEPVHDGLPMRYRPSKKGHDMLDRMSFTMQSALQPDEFDEENAAFFAAMENTRC